MLLMYMYSQNFMRLKFSPEIVYVGWSMTIEMYMNSMPCILWINISGCIYMYMYASLVDLGEDWQHVTHTSTHTLSLSLSLSLSLLIP